MGRTPTRTTTSRRPERPWWLRLAGHPPSDGAFAKTTRVLLAPFVWLAKHPGPWWLYALLTLWNCGLLAVHVASGEWGRAIVNAFLFSGSAWLTVTLWRRAHR